MLSYEARIHHVVITGAPHGTAKECIKCEAGTRVSDDGAFCITCLPGTFSKEGSTQCTECPEGTFSSKVKSLQISFICR